MYKLMEGNLFRTDGNTYGRMMNKMNGGSTEGNIRGRKNVQRETCTEEKCTKGKR